VQPPEDVVIGLRNVRDTFDLRFNRTAKVVGGASFDVNGNPRKPEFEARWELWDTDPAGNEYKVMTVEKEEKYVPPGYWLVELVRLIDPARYGGDLSKMVQALVDEPNARMDALDEDHLNDLIEYLGDMFFMQKNPRMSLSTVKNTPSFMTR